MSNVFPAERFFEMKFLRQRLERANQLTEGVRWRSFGHQRRMREIRDILRSGTNYVRFNELRKSYKRTV